MAHSKEAHGKMAAMPQFNKGHWVKSLADTEVADMRYSSGEFNQAEDYKRSVDKLASYAKKHKAEH